MKPLHLVCALALAAQITACGGGGSDGGGTTPPPSSSTPPPTTTPPTTTPPTTTPPAAKTVKVTLNGAVTDDPIPNAVVTATVGSQTFTATADASGNYTLPIEVEEANAAAFVTLSAKGAGAQSYVEFTSLAGTLSSLVTQAGSDGTLSNTENFATQITNVSTAQAVLLKEANGGQPITSTAQLEELGSVLDAQSVLDVATAIKLAVDHAADYPLPAGQTSILALVTDPAARDAFLTSAHDKDPEVFASTQTAVAQDPDLSQPLTTSSVPASITAAMLSTDPNFTFNYFDRVSAFTFAANGTGTATATSFDRTTTWALEGANIKVTYATPVETVSYDTETCNGLKRQVEAHYVSTGVTLTLLSSRALAITETSDITYADCPSLAPRKVTTTSARTILADTDFQVGNAEELKGTSAAIWVYNAKQDDMAVDIATFAADGTGTTRLLGKTFTWSMDSTGRVVTATYGDGSVMHYRGLRDIDELSADLFYEGTAGNRRIVGAGPAVDLDDETAVTLTDEGVVGTLYQWGVGDEVAPDPRLKGFRLRIDDGGVGAQVYDYIDEQDQVVTVDEQADPYSAFTWKIINNMLALTKTATYPSDLSQQVPNCTLGTPDCGQADVRLIVPLGVIDIGAEQRVYVLEKRRVDYDHPVTNDTPATYLIRYYETDEGADSAQSVQIQAFAESAGATYVPELKGAALH